jgi:4-amino-4-deoxy-L-arabinose transferase-like glycosyltransferase
MSLKRWLPVALLLVAFAMRTAWLTEVPPGLHHDEVINGVIADKALAGGWSIFYPEGQGREGFYYVFVAAALKWLGTGAFVLRLPSVALGMLCLSAVYALTRRLFGSFVALFALAEMSFTFWSVFAGRVALRAIAEPLVAALAAWALWNAIQAGKSVTRRISPRFILAGALIGLAVYTYRGARALPAIIVALPVYLALFDRATLKRIWRGLLICTVVAVLVAMPLVVLLTVHPELDQLAWAGRDQVLKALSASDVRPVLGTTVATLGAFFFRGDPDDYYNLGGRPVFSLVTGALFVVGVLIALKRTLRGQLPYAYLLMWFALALAPGMVSEPAPHFYRIIGAQVAAFAFPGIALKNLQSPISNLKWGMRSLKIDIGYLMLVVLILADGTWNAHDYFVVWGNKETVRVLWNTPIAEVANYLDHSGEQTPVAICTLLVNRREPWLRTAPDFFHYLMRRDASPLRFYDCRYSLVLPNGGAEARYAFPGTGPLNQFVSRFLLSWFDGALPVADTALPPDLAPVRVDDSARLEGRLKQLNLAPVDFDHAVELMGYELDGPDPRPGQPVVLLTWWRTKQKLAPNLTMFVHLLQGEHIVAQQDLLSVMPDTLEPGDVFAQVHEFVNVPPDALPGDYALAMGLYDSLTGQRLTIYDGNIPRGDRLTLTTIHIP